MKTIDERELQNNNKRKTNKGRRSKGNKSWSESVRAKRFCCVYPVYVYPVVYIQLYPVYATIAYFILHYAPYSVLHILFLEAATENHSLK